MYILKTMSNRDEFDKKLIDLKQEAAALDIKIITIKKGTKRSNTDSNSSIGKQISGINKKRMANEGTYYVETKERISLNLTPTAKRIFRTLAEEANLSLSETLERCLRLLADHKNFKNKLANLLRKFR